MNYKIWDKQESLVTPIGEVLTKEQVFAKYPMSELIGYDFIICDAPISLGVFMEYTQTKEIYKERVIDSAKLSTMTEIEVDALRVEYETLSKQDTLDVITFLEENQPEPEPSAEERIASALEFQNLLSLPDSI